MDPKLLIKVIKRWGWLGAIPVVVVALYMALSYRAPSTVYQVVMQFTTGSEPASEVSPDYDRYYAWLSSEYIANGLADFAKTSYFARGVTERLSEVGVSLPPDAVQGAIATDNAQSILLVYITWPDPEQAIAVADAVSAELLEAGPEYYPQMQGAGAVGRQADVPRVTALAPGLRAQLLGPALRLALAVAVGAGLMVVAYYVDPWIRSSEEIRAAGLKVVGTIPRTRSPRHVVK